MATTRKTFTAEFKLDAILDPHTSTFLIPGVHLTGGIADGLGSLKLAKTNSNIEETARNLGIGSGALHRWIRQQKQHEAEGRPAFTGYGKPALTEQEARIRQLERELDVARQERDILKKAVACLNPKTHLLAAKPAPDGLAALTGGIASLPRNPNEIPIHPRSPSRIQPRDHAADARGVQKWIP